MSGEAARESTGVGTLARVSALGAVVGAIALVSLVMFGGGGAYEVKARFLNAGQLVKGNLVEIGGLKAGTVEGFEITPDGLAEVTLAIDDLHAPLPDGTRAIIRQGGQASVAGRYVDLHMPSADGEESDIPDGGLIGVDETTTSVDFDQFLNMFDAPTRRGVRGFFRGGQRQYIGRGERARQGLFYLNPSLSASSRLFRELTYDPPVLERFLVDSSRFVTALAERRDDLAALVGNLNRTTRALGSEKLALAEVIERFPDFMRTANTTYVNLRSTLDEVDPLVEASKPVAQKLGPYLDELRPFANDAVPTVRNLSRVVRSPGASNDLVELNRTYPALARIALDTRVRNGEPRRGAFPELTEALTDSAPIVAHGRPYTVEFVGWFDDFSHTGVYDALGSVSRSQQYFNAFTLQLPPGVPCPPAAQVAGGCLLADFSDTLGFDTGNLRGDVFSAFARTEQFKRCPGASEEPAPDNSNVFLQTEQDELDCDEADRATGPIP